MRTLIMVTLALTVTAAGCDDGNQVDFSGDDLGPELHSILSEEGFIKLGLTREWVYFALSDSARVQAQ